jgi:hypothetical protein
MTKKQGLIFALLGVPTAILLLLSNYSGVCRETGNALAANEYIRKAAERVVLQSKHAGSNVIKYATVDEFLQMNANCCDVQFTNKTTLDAIERYFGQFGVTVTIHYRKARCGDDQFMDRYFWVTSCGQVRTTEPSGYRSSAYRFSELSADVANEACNDHHQIP